MTNSVDIVVYQVISLDLPVGTVTYPQEGHQAMPSVLFHQVKILATVTQILSTFTLTAGACNI